MPDPESKYVTLRSIDGFDFIVRRDAADGSKTLERAFDPRSGFEESLTGLYKAKEEILSGDVFDTVCQFLYYKLKNQGTKSVPDMELPKEQLLQLVLAADYLQT